MCAVPALRALRAALPRAEIWLVGLDEASFLLERFPDFLDELILFPGWPGMPEKVPQPAEVPHFLSEMQSRRFDLAIQMHGSGAVFNAVTALFGASCNAGQYLPGNFCPDPARFIPYEGRIPEVRRCLKIVENLGFAAQGENLDFPVTSLDNAELSKLSEFKELEPGNFIVIHPGASTPDRRWPLEFFGAVGDALAARGIRIVLTGSAAEIGLTRELARRMSSPVINLAGTLSLGGLAALLQKTRLLICNDTGVSHLADALKVKSVVIFSRSDPILWAPLDRQLHRAVMAPAQKGAIPPHETLRMLSGRMAVAQVLSEAHELLNQTDLIKV